MRVARDSCSGECTARYEKGIIVSAEYEGTVFHRLGRRFFAEPTEPALRLASA